MTHIISAPLKHSNDELLNINPLSTASFINERSETLEDFNTAGDHCCSLCLRSHTLGSKVPPVRESPLLIDIFSCLPISSLHVSAPWRPLSNISWIALLAFLSTFCFSFSRLVNTDAIKHSVIRRIRDVCLPWLVSISIIGQQLYLKYSSHSWQSLKVSCCAIGASDRRRISAGPRHSRLWWVQHVNDLCVFIGHEAGRTAAAPLGGGKWRRTVVSAEAKSPVSAKLIFVYAPCWSRLRLPHWCVVFTVVPKLLKSLNYW